MWTFHYLNAFPALDTIALQTVCDQGAMESQAETYGWQGGDKYVQSHLGRSSHSQPAGQSSSNMRGNGLEPVAMTNMNVAIGAISCRRM